MFPHDRRSGADDVDQPWPGYVVGGPHPRAVDWRDEQDDYRTNEIAINWNAALIYALAACLEESPAASCASTMKGRNREILHLADRRCCC